MTAVTAPTTPTHPGLMPADEGLFRAVDLVPLLALVALSSLFWMIVGSTGGLGRLLGCGVVVGLAGLALFEAVVRSGTLVPLGYLCATQPLIRMYLKAIGYLCIEYLVVALAAATFLKYRVRGRGCIVLLGIYMVIELADLPRAIAPTHYSDNVTRGVVWQSAALLGMLMIAARSDWSMPATRAVLRSYLVGTVTLGMIVLTSVLTGNVRWSEAANFQASAGMGPNQVGDLLASGAFAALVAAECARSRAMRVTAFGLVGLQALASLLTFTRGAGYALGAVIVLYLASQVIRRPSSSARALLLVALLAGVVWMAIDLTDSMLVRRFEKQGVSSRDVIARRAWTLFLEHPFLGIGTANFFAMSAAPGGLKGVKGTHNEILRSLTEHGLVGGSIYLAFLLTALRQAWRGDSGQQRTFRMLWYFLFLYTIIHGALKLAAQGLLLALACEPLRDRRPDPDPVPNPWGGQERTVARVIG